MPFDSIPLLASASTMLSPFHYDADMDTPADRLRRARLDAGFATIAEASRQKGFHKQNLADRESGRRNISPEQAAEFARAFRVSPEWLLYGTGEQAAGVQPIPEGGLSLRSVPVRGEVRAGVFAEIPEEEPFEGYVPVSLPAYDKADLFALRVSGRSMDIYYPDGSTVIVCPAAQAGVMEGDHVVVRRMRSGWAETTIKEVVTKGGKLELWPRSSDPAYQRPITLDTARDADEGPTIVGVVVGAILDRGKRSGVLINL